MNYESKKCHQNPTAGCCATDLPATTVRCPQCGGVGCLDCADAGYVVRQVAEDQQLRALIKVLCSDPSPYGSEAFRRTRDTVNPGHRALLLAVFNDGQADG